MMDGLRPSVLALAASLMIAGCWSHSFPTADTFIRSTAADCRPQQPQNCLDDNVVHIFADANGTFYPSGWKSELKPRSPWPAGSLLNASRPGSKLRRLVEADQPRQLAELARIAQGNGRIFILVHGYNNDVREAGHAFGLIEQQLDIRSDDRIIRFYWDGLTASGLGGLRIWFYAAGNSQLVGSRALRDILRQYHNREIYLIGHSRGSSVILSALGNGVYDPRFINETRERALRWGEGYADLLAPPRLEPNGNRIHILLAAPAIDRIDFCDSRAQPASPVPFRCEGDLLRPLGEQVRSFRYTVNARDPVLNKFVGLSRNFNPTGLGLREEVGRELKRERYAAMQAYVITPSSDHAFAWYVAHPEFKRMLREAGIARTGL